MELDFYPNEIITEGLMKIRIEAVGGDLDRVVCRYPRSFMDEMARQLTAEIETALGIEGLGDSSVQLIMAFAPNTYLEHICENVTYRRLMLMDKVSAPRDFWVKWTRLAGDVSEYSAENIRFELGEDVEQKIREKEYRYLLATGNEKYHNSMGRKKVTEWREVIKRAAKRGELTKIETDFELAPETLELEERIADLLGKRPADRGGYEKEEIPFIHSDDDEFERAMEKARMVVADMAKEPEDAVLFEEEEIRNSEFEIEDEEFPELIESDNVESIQELPEEVGKAEEEKIEELAEIEEEDDVETVVERLTPPEEENFEILDEEVWDFEEETEEVGEAEEDEIEEEPEVEGEIEEETEEEPEVEGEIEKEIEEEPEAEAEPWVEPQYEEKPEEVKISTPLADRAADIRAEIETKIRLEYESRARARAEQELIALRRERDMLRMEKEALLAEAEKEQARLRLEYEHLVEQTARAEAQREAEEERRIAEEMQLRVQIEEQLRAEARERERYAEAARMAIEEQHRLEAENARIARQREEEERIEAERLRREQEERELEALRQAELERIRREEEEAKERARAAMPEMGDGRYSYTTKSVKLIFRRSVDPNITTRIHEIIKATVEYYGKDRVYLKIRASVPDSQTVVLDFEHVPIEEMTLLGNIIKILGHSGLGIAKAIIE